MKGKYLITTSEWFYAPDGKSYRAVYGDVTIVDDTVLGVKTNRNATNWYAIVKGKTEEIIVAGCQIHYAVKTDKKPNLDGDVHHESNMEKCIVHQVPTKIYIAQ